MKNLLIYLINFYQTKISVLFPPSCRFYPSCSQYSKLAIKKYGIFKGGYISIKRIIRCNPFNKGGYDPVP